MAKPHRRFQFIHPAIKSPLYGRLAGALGRSLRDVPSYIPANVAAAYASNCITDLAWGADDTCQSYFPNGPSDALAALGASSGCSLPDTSSMTAKMNDLQANWNPTGVYTPTDLDSIVGRVMDAVNVQHNAVMTMQATYDPGYLDSVGDTYNDIGAQAVDYTTAARTAISTSNNAVNAPGLKVWVVTTMSALIDGMNSLGVAACTKPFWLDALGSFDSAISAIWGAAKAVAGAAITLAKTAVQAVEKAVGFVAWLVNWGPWLAGGLLAAGAGFYVWNHHTRRYPALLPGAGV